MGLGGLTGTIRDHSKVAVSLATTQFHCNSITSLNPLKVERLLWWSYPLDIKKGNGVSHGNKPKLDILLDKPAGMHLKRFFLKAFLQKMALIYDRYQSILHSKGLRDNPTDGNHNLENHLVKDYPINCIYD